MARQDIGINLSFTADTQQAKTQLQDLQNHLTKLTKTVGSKSPLGLTEDISSAIGKVTQLQAALQKSTTKAGKLDLGQFHQELNKANLDAEKIANSLSKLGTEGQTAFAKLAQSVTMAKVPIKRTSKLLNDFATTLKNTARWQISSNLLHGFTGALQGAYRYAQDLNESLTNIRIITGQSVEQMADFAKQANESAKALSATTTAYTDAALIFYQQGLTGDAVTERTDAVIKMSNVTGDAVEDVSSYMTAIWNNFDDGSQSLEHYADVITALGAATASSSAEIANGLERFAAIGETVGLSYEYATSALATVVATTRQSEEIVGTAFKSIFARMQGLKLGETLDDGTDLTKYSQALESVGVHIKDQNGQLKDMDVILDELGAKWQTLGKDQQNALAQTVAGTRQYTQLMALMNNWDFFQQNVEVARNSEGALQEQADVYAESWEAASKRVKTSLQTIFDQLINDKFFIKLNNGLASTLDKISEIIDVMGGLQSILPLISTLIFKMFGSDFSKVIDNFIYNIQLSSKKFRDQMIQQRKEFNLQLASMKIDIKGQDFGLGDLYIKQGIAQNELIEKTAKLSELKKDISEQDKTTLALLSDQNNVLIQQYQNQSKVATQLKQDALLKSGYVRAGQDPYELLAGTKQKKQYRNFEDDLTKMMHNEKAISRIQNVLAKVRLSFNEKIPVENIKKNLTSLMERLNLTADEFSECDYKVKELWDRLNAFAEHPTEAGIKKIEKALRELNSQGNTHLFDDIIISLEELGTKHAKTCANNLKDLRDTIRQGGNASVEAAEKYLKAAEGIKRYSEEVKKAKAVNATLGDKISNTAMGISSFAFALSSLSSVFETFKDGEVTFSEFISSLTTISFIIPSIIMGINSLKSVILSIGPIGDIFLGIKSGAISAGQGIAELIGFLGPYVVAIAAVVAAIGGLIYVYKKMKENSPEGQLKAATEKAKELKTALEEAKNANLEFTNSFNSYNEAIEKLKTLQKDTDEYTEAVRKANEEALKLIESNKNLASIASREDGLIVFDDNLLKEEQRKSNEKVLNAQIASYNAEIEKNIRQQIVDDNRFRKKIGYQVQTSQTGINPTASGVLTSTTITISENQFKQLRDLYEQKGDNLIPEDIEKEFLNIPPALKKSVIEKLDDINEYLKNNIKDTNDFYRQEIVNSALSFNDNFNNLEASQQQYVVNKNTDYKDTQEYQNAYEEQLADLQDQTLLQLKETYVSIFGGSIEELELKEDELKERIAEAKATQESLQQLSENDIANVVKIQDILSKNGFDEQTRDIIQKAINGENVGFEELLKEEDLQELQNKLKACFVNADLDETVKEEVIKGIEEATTFNADRYWEQMGKGKTLSENAGNILSAYQSDSELDEKQLANLETLKRKYKELNEIKEEGSHEYLQTLREIQEFEETNYIKSLEHAREEQQAKVDQLKKEFEELKGSPDIKAVNDKLVELQTALDDLTQKDYEIKLALEKDFDSDIDQAFGLAEEFGDLQDLISEDLTITFEQAQEIIARGYGEMLQNAKETSEQKIQLDKETLNAYIDNKQAEIEADKESKIQQLENEKVLIEARINLLTQKKNFLKAASEAETAQDAARALAAAKMLDQELLNNQKALEQMMSDEEAKNEEIAKDNSKLASFMQEVDANMAKNAGLAAEAAAQSGQSLAQSLIENARAVGEAWQAAWEAMRTGNFSGVVDTVSNIFSQGVFNGESFNGTYAKTEYTLEGLTNKILDITKGNLDEIKQGLDEQIAEVDRALAEEQNKKGAIDAGIAALKSSSASLDKAQADAGTGKGSGVGSSKSPEQKEHKEYLEDLADRYHDLNEAIEEVEHSMTMLSKLQDHLSGGNLIKSLKEQNKLLEKQKQNYVNLTAEIKKEQEEIRQDISKYSGSSVNYMSNDGSLNNYFEIFDSMKNKYNAAVDAYNKAIDDYNALSDETKETAKDTTLKDAEDIFKQEEEIYNKAKEALDKYDETVNKLKDNEEKQQELLYQQIENNLQAFEVDIQLDLDIEDAKRKVNNFIKDINQNFKRVYKTTSDWMKDLNTGLANAKTYTEAGGTIETRLKEIKEVQAIVDNSSYDYNSPDSMFVDRSEALEKLKEYTEELMDKGKELYELYKDAWEEYLDAIDQIKDQWDDIIDDFDKVNDTLDHYEKVIELLYGGGDAAAGRQFLAQLYEAAAANSIAKQQTLRDEIKALEKEYQELVALGSKEGDEDLKRVTEAIEDANNELTSEIENYLDTIQSQLINSIHSIMDTANKSMTKGYGIDMVIDRWNDAKDAAEGYYDEVERVYQLERMESLWENALRDTKTVKNQQYLKKIMDSQLENLKEKTNLSEYDVELAEKELAILQAQMALEDARNNKNTMKLTRNEIGDWTYQYVADEDDVANKEEDLLNKLYDKYEYVKTSSEEATEALLELYQTAQERLSALMEEYQYADADRRKEIEEEYDYLYNYYYGPEGIIIQKATETHSMENDLNKAGMELLWDLYEVDQDNYEQMTDHEKQLISELKEHGINSFRTLMETVATDDESFYNHIKDTCREVIKDGQEQWQILAQDVIRGWYSDPNGVRATMQKTYNDIRAEVAKYDAAIVASEQASGIAWSNVTQQIEGTRAKTEEARAKVQEVIEQTDGLSRVKEVVKEIEEQWNKVQKAIESASKQLPIYAEELKKVANAQREVAQALVETAQAEAIAKQISDAANNSGGGNGSGSGSGSGLSGNKNSSSDIISSQNGKYILVDNSTRGIVSNSNEVKSLQRLESSISVGDSSGFSIIRESDYDIWKNPLWDYRVKKFASGGYTGDWSDGSGKIGILHSKELVLNKEDTENILGAVGIVRSISNVLQNLMTGMTSVRPSAVSNVSNTSNDNKTFNITAEFPNANNVDEIREAILSLPTLASQFIGGVA